MEKSILIESSLMRSIVDKILPNGLLNDDEISQMNEEEKKQLYQNQKLIIQEFQKRSDQEICACTSVLRNLNEDLLTLRKNQLKSSSINNQSSEPQIEILQKDKIHDHKNIEQPPLRAIKSARNPRFQQKQHTLSRPVQKKPVKSHRPPFRH